MRRSLTALTAVLNQETHRCVEGEITMPSSSGGQDTKRSKKTSHGRGKDEEEGNEETKSGRKNLRRQSECGRKKKDRCFRHGGRRGKRLPVMRENLRATLSARAGCLE